MPRNWENEFLWVITAKGKSFCSITKRITWGATIYHLWRLPVTLAKVIIGVPDTKELKV